MDMNKIAETIAIDFVATVKASNLADAQEIESIRRSFNDAWAIYIDKANKIGERRLALIEEQSNAEAVLHSEVQALSARLEKYGQAKSAGAGPQSDMDKPAKPNGKLSDLGGHR